MDSKDRDESKIRRREETLARRVGEALDQADPHGAGKCPDAEVIAAYAEQALAPAESEQWEGHFATCARCRKILRVLAASVDTPLAEKEVAQLGERISAVRAPVEITGKSGGRARPRGADWRMRWLAPALGVAAVLAFWFAMRPPWRATHRGASATLIAQAPKEEVPLSPAPAEVDRLSRVAPQQDRKTQAAPTFDRSSSNVQSLNSPVEEPARGRADASNEIGGMTSGAKYAAGSLQGNKKLNSLTDGKEIRPPAVTPPPPSPSSAPATTGTSAVLQSEAKAELDTAAEQAPQVKTKPDAVANVPPQDKEAAELREEVGAATGGVAGQQALTAFRQIQNYSSLLKAPSGSILWRAGKGGMIERSTDGGKTWVSQKSPSQEDWLAGAAVSDTVCWVVGRNGAIARTLDGAHWERVSPPEQTASTAGKMPDWTGLTTDGGQSVTIAASDGRHFATHDGGKTWQTQ